MYIKVSFMFHKDFLHDETTLFCLFFQYYFILNIHNLDLMYANVSFWSWATENKLYKTPLCIKLSCKKHWLQAFIYNTILVSI